MTPPGASPPGVFLWRAGGRSDSLATWGVRPTGVPRVPNTRCNQEYLLVLPPFRGKWIVAMSSLLPRLPHGVTFKSTPFDPFGRRSAEEQNDAGIHPWGALSCRAAAGDHSRRGVRLDVCAIGRRVFGFMLGLAGRRSASAALADVSRPCAQTRSTQTGARSRSPRTEIPSPPTRQAGPRRPDERLRARR